jgi:tetratricopeptide (TPR) repeat protein
LNIYDSENAKIGFVYLKMGYAEEGEKLLEKFQLYAENDHSIYKHSSLALYYAYKGDSEKAIEHLQLFSKESNYFYWTALFMPIEPLFGDIKDSPQFKETIGVINTKFQKWHEQVNASLKAKNLI